MLRDIKRKWDRQILPLFNRVIAAVNDTAHEIPVNFFYAPMSPTACEEESLFYPLGAWTLKSLYGELPQMGQERAQKLATDVYSPYCEKWNELCQALKTRYPQSVAIADFENRLRKFLGDVTVNSLRALKGEIVDWNCSDDSELAAAFVRIGQELAAEKKGEANNKRRPRYPKDQAALAALQDMARLSRTMPDANNREIVEEYLKDNDQHQDRLRHGKDGDQNCNEASVVKNWSIYLSAYKLNNQRKGA